MGGTYKSHGNCSPVAEYNYWCDPDAAAKVFEAYASLPELSGKNIHMIGLDVTRKIVLTPNLIEYMKRLHPFLGGKIKAITRFIWTSTGSRKASSDASSTTRLLSPILPIIPSAAALTPIQQWKPEESATDRLWWMPANSGKSRTTAHILTETDPYRFWLLFCCQVLGADETAVRHMLSQILTEEVTA